MRLPVITHSIQRALYGNTPRVSPAPSIDPLRVDSAQHPQGRRRGSERRRRRLVVSKERRNLRRRLADHPPRIQSPAADTSLPIGKYIDVKA